MIEHAYTDGYEDGLEHKYIRPEEKHWHKGPAYQLYKRGHFAGLLDYAECYGDGRMSVIKHEQEAPREYFYDNALYVAYLLGRREEQHAY